MSGEIQAPAILYHRFANDTHDATSTYTRFSDLKAELQKLYDAGYSLVSMSSWLNGTFSVPAGRRPLLFTLDDGIFADQLYIDEDGVPSQLSGLGILYQFSQEHPDFGYAASIYVNTGDKYYGDLQIGDWFYVSSDASVWKKKLADTIVWMMEHNIEIYNHTYTHVDLSATSLDGITYQLQKNDETVRDYLALANRSDLDAQLGNIIALPYGIWPSTQEGIDLLKNYRNPEGKPVAAILEAYNADEPQLTPSVFTANYDRMSLPRITSTVSSIDWVVAHKDEIPTAQSCQLGPTLETQAADPATLQSLISSAVQAGTCPSGVYHAGDLIFVAQNGSVSPFTPSSN
jgi:peptidoglycan/xylan/chitin deacetylase (PgdA/CDA1 family)